MIRLTLVDVALNHDTHDGGLALGDLLGKNLGNLGLVLVILVRVAVAAVNHQTLAHALLSEGLLGLGDALRIVVGALGTATEDDEAVLVAGSTDNGNDAGLGDGQEVMRVPDSANGVNGNTKRPIGAVLETNGETQTTS